MAYTPDPTDSSQPVSGVKASTAAAEFRALKQYIAALAGLTPITSISALTVQQLNGGQLAGLRNMLINGRGAISQRIGNANLNLTTTAVYGVDRWACLSAVAASGTIFAAQVSGDSTSPTAVRFAKTAGTYDGTLYMGQVLESADCVHMTSKPFAFSFRARVGSSFTGSLLPQVFIYRGTVADQGLAGAIAGSWTGWTNETYSAQDGSVPNLSTVFQTYKYVGTFSGTVGEVFVGIGRATDASAGSANDYLDITDIQFEVGTVATPFEQRPHGLELELCKRYYEVGAASQLWSGYVVNASVYYVSTRYSTAKRVAPTLTYSDVANSSFPAGLVTFLNTSPDGFTVSKIANATANAGYYQFNWTAAAEL